MRSPANPLTGLPKAREAEHTRKRRPLTEDEIARLLKAAQERPLRDVLTVRRGKNKGKPLAKVRPEERQRLERLGRERALTYKFMILTGLRRGEVAPDTPLFNAGWNLLRTFNLELADTATATAVAALPAF